MKKFCLLLLVLIVFIPCRAVEPWSGIGVVFFKCHYPIMTEESVNLDIFDSTLTRIITTINFRDCNDREDVELVEFADEVKGLCIASMRNDAIKVILSDLGGHVRYGWVKRDNAVIDYRLWSALLPSQREVFPLNNKDGVARIAFFKAPDGDTLDMQIPRMKELWYDYKNEVKRLLDCDLIPTGRVSQGGWMQVDVSTPHDEGDDDFECRRIRCWIRYLDESGHPLVWYYTRD
jgi:hypothetical protein